MANRSNLFVNGVLSKPCNVCGCQITEENCVYKRITVLGVCKSCYSERVKIRNSKRYMNGPEDMRQSRLGMYKLSIERYTELLKKQNGVCAICEKINQDGRPLFVDHNHITGETRALLCFRCNIVIGHCNEDKDLLMEIVNYLIRYSSVESKV